MSTSDHPLKGPADPFQESHSMDHSSSGLPRNMPFHLLEAITDCFSKERRLGTGAFGKVFMGVYNNGEKIAVKMLHDMPGLEEEQFLNEFNNLSRLQHPNIVRLIGYCYEIKKERVRYNGKLVFAERIRRALCFEYMHHGSLDKHLTDEDHGFDWNICYTLIKGICKGLEYLHEKSIYHLDLKPANILLDENKLPKIADFGLSRFFGEEQTQITRSSVGTRGYLPPEYIDRNIISSKFDIFSLGVVIIKMMTGSTGYIRSADMPAQEFIELVHKKWRNKLQATPAHLLESYSKQVKGCIEIALSCVEADRHKRPNIGGIIKRLDEIETLVNGTVSAPQPAFNRDTLQQRLQAITQGSTEAWTYVIFWEYSVDAITGSSLLGWGDGNYKGCKEDHYSPVDKAELEHRKRVLCEFNTVFYGSGSDSDTEWSNLIASMRSFLNSTHVLRHKQEHRKLFLSQLTSLISSYATPTNNATSLDDPNKLSCLLSTARCFKEDITDAQWFLLGRSPHCHGPKAVMGSDSRPDRGRPT